MLLQPSLHHHKVSLSSTLAYSSTSFPLKNPNFTLPRTVSYRKLSIVTCSSVSKVHSYGTVDYDKRPIVKWNAVYRRISLMENPENGAGSVLNQWEKGGKQLTKWELCRVVKELRKFKRFGQALEVYDWMNNRPERFRIAPSDAAIQLDLVAKVRGVSAAEEFFTRLPDSMKDRRIYGSLLNAYVRTKMREKAESLIESMRSKGYATHALPFNVMMTLYMNLNEYDKVDLLVQEMMDKNIRLDIYSYNIWISSCGAQGSVEKMEEVFEQMKKDTSINPNWTTFSTMATMYIKMGVIDKAEDCLRKVESRITGRDRIPYHYLLSLYGNAGNKEEIYRVWNIYKSIFPSIPNLGYHAILSSLVRLGDIEGAEKIHDEWLSVKTSYDPRIGNLFISWYVREGNFEKAKTLFDQMLQEGGKPNSNTWEILAEGHICENRISDALSCLQKAFTTEGSKSWKPKPVNILAFFKLCEDEGDIASKEVLEGLFRQSQYLENKAYASLIGLSGANDDSSTQENGTGADTDENEDAEEGSEVLVGQLEGSL